MYGIDVISVLNKAIDSNEKNKKAIANGETELYVDVTVKINKTIGTRVEEYRLNSEGTYDMNNKFKSSIYEFKAGNTYTLSANQAMFETLIISKMGFTDDQNGISYNGNDTSERVPRGNSGYDIIYYPAAEFRRATFVCKEVKYSKETGKVVGMTFEQYK